MLLVLFNVPFKLVDAKGVSDRGKSEKSDSDHSCHGKFNFSCEVLYTVQFCVLRVVKGCHQCKHGRETDYCNISFSIMFSLFANSIGSSRQILFFIHLVPYSNDSHIIKLPVQYKIHRFILHIQIECPTQKKFGKYKCSTKEI